MYQLHLWGGSVAFLSCVRRQ